MTDKNKWIKEYEKILDAGQIQKNAIVLMDLFQIIFKKAKIKVILTSRIKSIESLNEKIERNKLDENDDNINKSIIEILDDMIGIRVICMKNSDEKKINDILIKNNSFLVDKNIEFTESLYKQPKHQKNGHSIYRIKGYYENKYSIELQIKSLSNLFWGEMEHLLIYKNNSYLMHNDYYKKEMNSIYDELAIIDSKLSYMEEIMINESTQSKLKEKKDILKRTLYLNLKEKFKFVQDGEYLNNNYIYDGIANYIFKEKKIKKSDAALDKSDYYDGVLLNSMNLLLDKNKTSFQLNQFKASDIDSLFNKSDKLDNELKGIIEYSNSGWWYFLLVSAIINYNKKNRLFIGSKLNTDIIFKEIKSTKDDIYRNIKIRLFSCFNGLSIYSNDEESILIKNIIESVKEQQLLSYLDNKDLRIMDLNYLNEFSRCASLIIVFLRDSINDNIELSEGNKEAIKLIACNIVEILDYSLNKDINIKSNLEEIMNAIYDISKLKLPITGLKDNSNYSLTDLINHIEKTDKEGESNDYN